MIIDKFIINYRAIPYDDSIYLSGNIHPGIASDILGKYNKNKIKKKVKKSSK